MTNYEQLTINLFNGDKITKTIKTDKQGNYMINTFLRRNKFKKTFELGTDKTKFQIFIEGEEEEIKEITDFNASYFYLEEAENNFINEFKEGLTTEGYNGVSLGNWKTSIDFTILKVYGNEEIKIELDQANKYTSDRKFTRKLKLINREDQTHYTTETFKVMGHDKFIYLVAYELDGDQCLTALYDHNAY